MTSTSLMSIGKFAEAVGVSPAALRRMHETGELIPARISKGGTRYYSEQQKKQFLKQDMSEEMNKIFIKDMIDSKNKAWSHTSYMDVLDVLMSLTECHIVYLSEFIELLDRAKITYDDIQFIKYHTIDILVLMPTARNWEQLSSLANRAVNTVGPDLSADFVKFTEKYEIVSAFAAIEKKVNHAYETISNQLGKPDHGLFDTTKKCHWERVKNFFDNETAYRIKIENLKKTLPEKITERYLCDVPDIYERITGDYYDVVKLKKIIEQENN